MLVGIVALVLAIHSDNRRHRRRRLLGWRHGPALLARAPPCGEGEERAIATCYDKVSVPWRVESRNNTGWPLAVLDRASGREWRVGVGLLWLSL